MATNKFRRTAVIPTIRHSTECYVTLDRRNRLTSQASTGGNGQSLTYTYAANGQKLAERYIRPMEYGAEFRYYIGPLELSCRFHNKPAISRINTCFGYLTGEGAAMKTVADYQGNIRAVVDAGGNALQATDYYPYGLPMVSWINASRNIKVVTDSSTTAEDYFTITFRFPNYLNGLQIFLQGNEVRTGKPIIVRDGLIERRFRRSVLSDFAWLLIPDELYPVNLFGQYFGITQLYDSLKSLCPEIINNPFINSVYIEYTELRPETFYEYYFTGQYIRISKKSIFWNGDRYKRTNLRELGNIKLRTYYEL